MGFGLCCTPALALAAADQLDLEAGYEGISQHNDGVRGLDEAQLDLGVVRGELHRELQLQRYLVTLGVSGEGGSGLSEAARFGEVSLKPEVKAEFARQTHHLALIGSLAYDQSGLVRRPLSEQWDNQILTAAERRRYRYLSAGSDHYFELGPRTNLSLYFYSSYLDQGLVTKAYGGGGYVEYATTPALRLRLGGTGQLYAYGDAVIRSAGPELGGVYAVSESCELTAKLGLMAVDDSGGERVGTTGKVELRNERPELAGRLSWERGLVNHQATAELTTSDTLALALRWQVLGPHGLELAGEQRHEEWVRGFAAVAPADSLRAELRYIYQTGGASTWLPGRGAWNGVAAYGSEYLTTSDGAQPMRQVVRFSIERVL